MKKWKDGSGQIWGIKEICDYIMIKLIIFSGVISILGFIGCTQTSKRTIDPKSVDSIVLVQVTHPYLGKRLHSTKLPDSSFKNFLIDFTSKHPEICDFYSCYVIKIFLKNGKLISYRTDGVVFEKFIDADEVGSVFIQDDTINLITKYWGIPEKEFCDSVK